MHPITKIASAHFTRHYSLLIVSQIFSMTRTTSSIQVLTYPTPNLVKFDLTKKVRILIESQKRFFFSSEGGKSSFSFDDHLSALSLLIGITNLLPLGSKHGNYNGPSQLPSVIDDRSILKPQAECVNIQQSKRDAS